MEISKEGGVDIESVSEKETMVCGCGLVIPSGLDGLMFCMNCQTPHTESDTNIENT